MRRGFTLLEVLAVVVILAVLASMAFGMMHFVESARIGDTEGRGLPDFAALLQYSSSHATPVR